MKQVHKDKAREQDSTSLEANNLELQTNALLKIQLALKKSNKVLKLLVLGLLLSFSANSQTIIYVDENANGNDDGSSWADAYNGLQEALDDHMGSNVDEIRIAEGLYTPTESPDGTTANDRDWAFHLIESDVEITGGYDPYTGKETGDNTVLSGEIGTANDQTDNCYHVFVGIELSSATILENLVVEEGSATGSGSISVTTSSSWPSWTIQRSYGAGIILFASNAKINRCVITDNTSSVNGAGLYAYWGAPSLENCLFYNNDASTKGVAVFYESNYSSSPVSTVMSTINCSFIKNTTSASGQHVVSLVGNQATSKLINSLFLDNTGTDISNALVSGSEFNASDDGTSGNADAGLGFVNLSTSGAFNFSNYTNPNGGDNVWMNNDDGLTIKSSSSVIGKGNGSANPATDIKNVTRVSIPSIGCYDVSTPGVILSAPNLQTDTSAQLNCVVHPNGLSTQITYSYGLTSALGSSIDGGNVSGYSAQFVSAHLSGLIPGRMYFLMAQAVNSKGTTYSERRHFLARNVKKLDLYNHVIGIDENGVAISFGDNTNGQLGASSPTNQSIQRKVLKGAYNGTTYMGDDPTDPVVQVATGKTHSLVLTQSGKLFAFGGNGYGQLGNGTTFQRSTATHVLKGEYNGTTHLGDNGSNPIVAIDAGANHSMVLMADGTVFTFGQNIYGQLGINSTTTQKTPVLVKAGGYKGATNLGAAQGDPIVQIACGNVHNLALSANGLVYAFGYNNKGQLGNNSTTSTLVPTLVLKGQSFGDIYMGDDPSSPVIEISAGSFISAIVLGNGGLYSFGKNQSGQLGIGNTTDASTARRVRRGIYGGSTYLGDGTDNPVVSVDCGDDHMIAQVLAGHVFTWGLNSDGRLGIRSTSPTSNVPDIVAKGGSNANLYFGDKKESSVFITKAGALSSIGLTVQGKVFSFGSNASGQLGNLTSTSATQPTEVLNTNLMYGFIAKGFAWTSSYEELTVGSAGSKFLKNQGDYIIFKDDNNPLILTEDNLPVNSNVISRLEKSWLFTMEDAGANGGDLDISFDIGSLYNPDVSFYLLERDASATDFSVVNNLSYSVSGNEVIFSVEGAELNSNHYYTIGMSDNGPGYSLDFDGVNDYVEIPRTFANYLQAQNITIEFWIKTSQTGSASIIEADATGDGYSCELVNGKIRFEFGPSNVALSSRSIINNNKWTHVCITKDYRYRKVRLYINGILEFTKAHTATDVTWAIASSIRIGAHPTLGSLYFDGKIDELKFWSLKRQDENIKDSLYLHNPGTHSRLAAYYKFDQTSESYLPDVSIYNLKGALNNFSLAGSSSNWARSTAPLADANGALIVKGAGRGLIFTGTERVPFTIAPKLGSTFTIETWMKSQNGTSISYYGVVGGNEGDFSFLPTRVPPSIFIQDGHQLKVVYGNGTAQQSATVSNVISQDVWHHIAWTCKENSGDADWKIYVDGILVHSETKTGENFDYGIKRIGKVSHSNFEGVIDELRMWNTERSESEIQENMFLSVDPSLSNLITYCDFDNLYSSTLPDLANGANEGTLTSYADTNTCWVDALDRQAYISVNSGSYTSYNIWLNARRPSSLAHNVLINTNVSLSTSNGCKNLVMSQDGEFEINGNYAVAANVFDFGKITGTGSTQMKGSQRQHIFGSGSYCGIEVDNGTEVVVYENRQLQNSIKITNGNLHLTDEYIQIENGEIIGNDSNYIAFQANTAKIQLTLASNDVLLPLGYDTYTPVTIKNANGKKLTIGLKNGLYELPNTDGNLLTTKGVNRTWVIKPQTALTDVELIFEWNQSEVMTNFDADYASVASTHRFNGSYYWTKHGVSSANTANGRFNVSRQNIDLNAFENYFGIGSDDSPYGETIYKIENYITGTDIKTKTLEELTIADLSGFLWPIEALQDIGDKIVMVDVAGDFEETNLYLPSNSNVAHRYKRVWQFVITDINSNGGILDMSFDLGKAPNPNYSYYLLHRNSTLTTGDFGVINNLNYAVDGNQIIFSVDLSELVDGYHYTIGRSDNPAGCALALDGSNDHVVIDGVSSAIASGDATIEGWFKSHIDNRALFAINTSAKGNVVLVHRNRVYDDLNGAQNYTNPIADSKWHHVAAVLEDGVGYKIYIDGKLEEDISASGISVSATDLFSIGQEWDNPAASQFLRGEVDEFRVWSELRSQNDIKTHMHRSMAGNETNLEAYYKFDQTTQTYLPDVSGNNHQGLLIGFNLLGDTSNWIKSAAPVVDKELSNNMIGPGSALDFDGATNYVSTTGVQLGDTFTIEAWIKHDNMSTSGTKRVVGGYNALTARKAPSLSVKNEDALVISYGDGTSVFTKTASNVIAKDEWFHVAWTCEAVQYAIGIFKINDFEWKLYVNGIVVLKDTVSDASYNTAIDLLGLQGTTKFFNGKLDDLRLWDDVRTETEIQDNMYASLKGDEDDLLAYYDFDNSSGTSLADITGNGNNGTLTNFTNTTTCWVSAEAREPFKTIRSGSHTSNNTWKGGAAPGASGGNKLAVFHDLTLGSAGTYSRMQVNSGKTVTTDADITVTSEVIVNGTANGTNKLILGGSSKQTLGGSGTLGALQVNNSSDVSLEGDLTIGGALTLTDGDIELNDHIMTLTGTTSHGSSASYLKINGTGGVKATVGSTPVILPIGRNPYLPITIDDGGGAEYTVGLSDKVYTDPTNNSTELTSTVVSETWTIQASTAIDDVVVELGWDVGEEASFDRTQSGIGYWETGVSSAWVQPASTTVATGTGPYFQTRTLDFTTNLFYFGVGGSGSPLPVELTYFNANWVTSTPLSSPTSTDTERTGTVAERNTTTEQTETVAERSRSQSGSALLTWQTATEENNSHFEVQRMLGSLSGPAGRSDGVEGTWQTIGTVAGQGTTLQSHDYEFIDNDLAEATNTIYYRLKQVDYNGQFEYSVIRTLNSEDAEFGQATNFAIFPNPSNTPLIYTDKMDRYRLLSTTGRVFKVLSNTRSIDVSDLATGTYIIENSEGNTQLYMRK